MDRQAVTITSADGTRLVAFASGHGPALVALGGALADHTALTPLLSLLSSSFRVYALDRRGCGGSGDTPPYSVDREVEDLEAVVAHVGPDAFLYGQSGGALLALEAVARGLPVSGLAVYEPPYIVNDQRPRPATDLPDRLRELVERGDPDAAVRLFLAEGPGVAGAAVDAMDATPTWPSLVALAASTIHDALLAGDCRIPAERIAAITVPVTVMVGGASPAWIQDGNEALVAALDDAGLLVLDDQGHSPDRWLLAEHIIAAFHGD